MKTLSEKSDVKALAKEIIEKCKLIHPSKILEVEQLLFYLQKRKDGGAANGKGDSKAVSLIQDVVLLFANFFFFKPIAIK